MSLTEAVFAVLVSLPGVDPSHADTTAIAIATAAPTPSRAARLLAVGYFESSFMPRIGLGECRRYECDAGRARSYFQLQATNLAPEWPRLLGLDLETVTLAARVADRILERGRRSCKTLEGTLAFYARSNCRVWPGAKRRAIFAERIERRLAQ